MGYNSFGTMKISFPLIETARLKLRLPSPGDVESIHSIWSDPEVMKFIPIILFRTREEIGEFIPLSIERWKERGFGIFAVTTKENDQMVGYCGLQYLDNTTEVEIYYGFSKDSWNKGIATEAARAVMRFGFEELKLDSIAGVTHPENIASQNVLEKIGMVKAKENRTVYDTECAYFAVPRENYSSNGECYRITYA
jgi:ribosomal-protein-alanine N-acetyltransferase